MECINRKKEVALIVSLVTCSGVNEKNSVDDLLTFCAQFPKTELGIQCSPKKFDEGRYEWLKEVCSKTGEKNLSTHLALHLNQEFAIQFCKGKIPESIETFLSLKNDFGEPLISRVQLNFMLGREKFENNAYAPDLSKLETSVKSLKGQRVILSCSQPNLPLIQKIHYRKMVFDALYDDSFGEGIAPKERKAPLFKDVYQGYAGGLGPLNIADELSKIARLTNASVFVDAEGKLKENGCFSFSKAAEFVQNIAFWQNEHLNSHKKILSR